MRADDPAGTDRHDAAAQRNRSGLFRSVAHRLADRQALPDEGRLPSLDRATAWLNSPPLTPAVLRGRVVLIDFWTFTCVNWLRTLPYLRAWHEKYADVGLTVVGVHTPEFGFEHDLAAVSARTNGLGITYPVAVDSDYGIWDDFANAYWPAIYLADAEGRIRNHHFGEGEYAMTEMVIQQLLADAGTDVVDRDLVTVEPRGLEVPADWASLRSPETYLGYERSSGFVAEDGRFFDTPHVYDTSRRLPVNAWNLSGEWTLARHAAVLETAGGRLDFAFHARDLNLIMGPPDGAAIPFRVTLDGRSPGPAHGSDVDAEGHGVAGSRDTYQLIRQPGRIADAVAGVEFLAPGVEAYCVTFG